MTNANPLTTEELSSVETMDTAKLMRFVQLIIELDNDRIKAEREAEEKKE